MIPDVNQYPVVKLEPAIFTQQQVDEMVNYFSGGNKLYLPQVKTKADYDEEIVLAKRGQEIDGEFVVTQESLDWVEVLENRRKAAPDDSSLIYTDTTLTYERDFETGEELKEYGKSYLSVMVENPNGEDAMIYVGNYTQGYSDFTVFSYYTNSGSYITESMYANMLEYDSIEEDYGYTGAGELFEKIPVTKEAALIQAEKAISDVNIKDLMLVNTEKAVCPEAPEICGYTMQFARQSSGIPLFWFMGGGWANGEEPPAYSPPFSEEILSITVSQYGIEEFSWRGYAKVVETVSKNEALMPFEDIQKHLINQINYKKSFGADMYMMSDYTVTVTSAELRMGYIGVKDRVNQALMVPIWVFENSYSYYNGTLKGEQSYRDDPYVLNAIDGGVIEISRD